MNILHVAGNDLRGARFNGYAMLPVAPRFGHRVRLAVWNKQSDRRDVSSFRRGPARYAQGAWSRANRLLGLDDLLAPAALGLLRHPWFTRADLIHAHLIDNDWFGAALFPLIARRKPLVVTVHSAMAATGGCYYPRECASWETGCNGVCPHPRGASPLGRSTPALHWRAKRFAYRRTPMTLVAASRWTERYLARSPLTRHLPRHVIPFGLDLALFHPGGRAAARARLGIAPEETVLAFRGVDIARDQVKGGAWLYRTLAQLPLPAPATLLIVDDARSFAPLAGRYRIIDRGWLSSDTAMAETLRAADLFLMPSLSESFGMMAVEAMACGTPVIVAEGTALPEVVHAPDGGLPVPPGDETALAAAITHLLTNAERRTALARAARAIVEQEYALEAYVRRHLDLYTSILDGRGQAEIGIMPAGGSASHSTSPRDVHGGKGESTDRGQPHAVTTEFAIEPQLPILGEGVGGEGRYPSKERR